MIPAAPPVATTFAPPATTALVFDACHVGVVLRAVLFVQAVVAVAALYVAESAMGWLADTAFLTGASLPGTLVWLITGCALKRPLQTLGRRGQYAAGVAMGAMAGLYACAMLTMAGMPPRWLASAATGALLAALLVTALILRASASMPADAQARLVELQSRIRPHFLFNTLNSAIALVRAEPAKAETLLEDLSDLFRYALAEPHATTTLAEEIELAKRYLAIEHVRFGPRLQVQWQLDEQVHQALLPPLLLQPLVENAIHHGVEPSAHGGKLQIRTERKGDRVVLQIINTLPSLLDGEPPRISRGHGMALANVRARLSLLHDLDAQFSARSQSGFFVVRLNLPLPASGATALR